MLHYIDIIDIINKNISFITILMIIIKKIVIKENNKLISILKK